MSGAAWAEARFSALVTFGFAASVYRLWPFVDSARTVLETRNGLKSLPFRTTPQIVFGILFADYGVTIKVTVNAREAPCERPRTFNV